MKTLRGLIYRQTISAVAFVAIAFLSLFFFFDLLDDMRKVGSSAGYTLGYAMLKVALSLPGQLYDLLPIAVLIGSIWVMARLAQSSEFTIMRTSGMGPWMALRTLLMLGLGFVLVTVLVGDYVAPAAERARLMAEAKFLGKTNSSGNTGAWMKERHGANTLAINVGAVTADGALQRVRIFEFDSQGRLVLQMQAPQGQIHVSEGHWQLQSLERTQLSYPAHPAPTNTEASADPRILPPQVSRSHTEGSTTWPTAITSEMLLAAIHKPDRMPTLELMQFIQHLQSNEQSTQKYEIEFWRKVFYPLSCLVMVVLALPFAYLHFRSGGIAGYMFGGVMAGISFFMLNNVFGYAGNLQNWSPILTAAAPGLIYSVLSLGALGWLVLRR